MKAYMLLIAIFFIPILVQSNLCKTGCYNCTSYDACISCSSGYSFISNTTDCISCPQKCSQCSFDQLLKATCTYCNYGYGITPAGNCEKCDQRCQFCEGRPENCSYCQTNFYRTYEYTHEDGPIYLCAKNPSCDDNCLDCSPLAGGLCTSCDGNSILFTGGCIACDQISESCYSDYVTYYYSYVIPYLSDLQAFYSNSNYTGNSTNSTNSSNNTVELPPLDVITIDYNNISDYSVDIQYLILHKFLYDQMSPNQTLTQDEMYTISSQIMNKQRKNRHLPFSQRISMMEDDLEELANISPGNLLEDLKNYLRPNIYFQCMHGYKYVNDTCVRCSVNCQFCSEYSCSYCQQTYTLDPHNDLGCIPCEPPCLVCSSFNQSSCYSCLPPYTMNAYGECMQCEQPCETCQTGSPTSCQICMRPYSKLPSNSTNECFTCADFNCLVCDEASPQVCYECLENLALDDDNTCKQCSDHCKECDLSTGSEVCFKCEEGYSSTESGCQACGGGGCKICSASDPESCSECEEGLYADSNKKCKICPEQCSTCENDQECLEYADGKVEVDGVVVDCRPGCNDCSEDPEICRECAEKYYADEGYCYKCSSGCLRCSSANDCTQCQYGFVQVSGSCQKCDSTCLQCQANDPTVCTTCKKGLTLNQGNCTFSCEQGCFECDSSNSTHCYECVEGYTLKSNGECVKCLSSCSGYCDPYNVTVCLGCSEGFQLKDNECVRCPEGCSSCSQGSCSDCYSGYSLTADGDDFVCEEDCKFPCTQCNDEGDVCLECASMFNFANGLCVPDTSCNPSCSFCPAGTIRNDGTDNCDECSSNCASCNQQMDCLECFSGYYLDSNSSTCESCTSNCDICASSEVCEQCEAGYLLVLMSETDDLKVYDSVCTLCDSNCLECIEQPNICTSCDNNHRLENTKCIGRFTVRFVFVLNREFNSFLSNSEMQLFIFRMSLILQINMDLIFITNLYEGSTAIEGSVSSEDQSEVLTRTSALQQNEDDLGFEVLSSNVNAYYDDSLIGQDDDDEEETEDVPVGAIAGGAVGGLIVIGIVVFAIYKKRQNQAALSDSGELHGHEKEKTGDQIQVTNEDIAMGG